MPVFAKNIQDIQYEIPVLPGPITLEPEGQPDSIAEVMSLLTGLLDSEYTTLAIAQVGGNVIFSGTDVTIYTGNLHIRSSVEVYDTSRMPIAVCITPESPVYFDTMALPAKMFQVEPKGAFEMDVFASIDSAVPQAANKRYIYIDKWFGTDSGLQGIPEHISEELSNYRWVKIDFRRGIPPDIISQFSAN